MVIFFGIRNDGKCDTFNEKSISSENDSLPFITKWLRVNAAWELL